jgi:hypothetical protein
MSSQDISDQRARKARDKRSLQRATILVGVLSLGLAGALTYAAAAATVAAKGPAAPAVGSNPSVTVSPTPTYRGDDQNEQPIPAPPVQSPPPGTTPVVVTGGS